MGSNGQLGVHHIKKLAQCALGVLGAFTIAHQSELVPVPDRELPSVFVQFSGDVETYNGSSVGQSELVPVHTTTTQPTRPERDQQSSIRRRQWLGTSIHNTSVNPID